MRLFKGFLVFGAVLLALGLMGVRPFGTSGEWVCFSGTCIIGHDDADSIQITTDGGAVTIDGHVQALAGPFVTLASGTLTVNTVHLATAAADYDIPAIACNASPDIGNWITLIVQDKNEIISIQPLDTSNQIFIPGADIDAGHEADSEADANNGAGDHLTLVCIAADKWFATSMGGVWVDGGAAD